MTGQHPLTNFSCPLGREDERRATEDIVRIQEGRVGLNSTAGQRRAAEDLQRAQENTLRAAENDRRAIEDTFRNRQDARRANPRAIDPPSLSRSVATCRFWRAMRLIGTALPNRDCIASCGPAFLSIFRNYLRGNSRLGNYLTGTKSLHNFFRKAKIRN